MSYHSGYEGYKSYTSEDDDVPMYLLQEKYGYVRQDNWSQPDRARSWNEEPLVIQEIEQPEMSNPERMLRKAIEQMEKSNREWAEFLNGNIGSNDEKPYETSTNADKHMDNVESIETNTFDSNCYVPYSPNFVFQDDSEDEMDEEEEENEVTNYPHETSQSILQELHTLKPEMTEDSDLEYLYYEDSDFKEDELEIEKEKLVKVTPILEATSIPAESSNVSLKDQFSPKINYISLDEELQISLGCGDEDTNELKRYGMMTEEEVLERMGMKVDETHPLGEKVEMIRDDDMLCLKTSQETSVTYLQLNTLPCEHEYVLAKEPKPPDPFIPASKNHSLLEDVLKLKIDTDKGVGRDWPHNIPQVLQVVCDVFLTRHWGMIRLISRPPENKWGSYVHITTIYWEMIYRNDKTKVDFLLCEYDWKGSGIMMMSPHNETSVGKLKPH